jgi:hypothetical protein
VKIEPRVLNPTLEEPERRQQRGAAIPAIEARIGAKAGGCGGRRWFEVR